LQLLINIAQIASAIVLLITATIIWIQTYETRRSTYAVAFKAVYDILQDEGKRTDRRLVLSDLAKKPYASWTPQDKLSAERVCASYDCAGIMCRNRLLPVFLVADGWGASLRGCWKTLLPLVNDYRLARNAKEYWDDFEWLARQAERYQRKAYGSTDSAQNV